MVKEVLNDLKNELENNNLNQIKLIVYVAYAVEKYLKRYKIIGCGFVLQDLIHLMTL